jgi:hypothetical protein
MTCPKHKTVECVPGKTRCEACLTSLREYQNKRREKLKTENKCVGTVTRSACAAPPREGKTMCQECADTFNKYQKERLAARKGSTP